MSKQVSICVIGSGYVGLVAAVCFAEIGHKVICVDNNEAKVKQLREGGVPIYEHHLPDLLAKHLNRGVEFTTDLGAAVAECEAIFIAVGTPQGSTGSADLSYVEAVVSEIARAVNGYKVIVEKSTVPVYTNEWISRVMHRHGVTPENFDVVSNPEFLREGTAIIDFLHPDRIVVGANNPRAAEVLQRIYAPLTDGSYFSQPGALPGMLSAENPAKLLVTSAQSAEIIKHASNAFLALKISFINAVANLAESVDADIEDIAAGMGLDSRIGPKFLRAGLGYGGSCFPKDVAAFYWVAQQQGVDFQILEEVRKINATQQEVFFNKVRSALWTLRGKKLAALGLAFKGDTDDIRDSPAIDVIKKLLSAGASITVYDPAAMDRAKEVLPPSANLSYATSAYNAAEGADALLILTDWAEFAKLDLQKLNQALRFPIIVDGRNLYKPAEMQEQGFTYVSVGRPAAYTAQQGKPRKLVLS
ncbi:UDP-glucose dehydrogenase family protein [Acidicapsa ligni]|uniref:UDP-glucose dehydrogenase family protein n=1 Tax=Acidicapsa ligni TaxID=542300 RepID=UPI0021E0F0E3|nr:UDP-glucose/GDP-mannose dehydrogenase family protein [Acidicapsa ligni]